MALAIKLNRVRHIIRVSSFLAESLDLFHQFLVDRVLQQVDLCPLGAIYGLLNRISLYRLQVSRSACVSCGKCQSACPMGVNPARNPGAAECIRCGECVVACPQQALLLKFSTDATKQY